MYDEDARAGTTKKIDEPSPEATGTAPKPATKGPKKIVTILKLNNNSLSLLDDFQGVLSKILFTPSALTMLDLSFNIFKTIDKSILTLPNLATLYLHGNQIDKLAEVDKLQGIPTLRAVTLHGNEIEKAKSYRFYVISRIPQLKKLDFVFLTKQDIESASSWRLLQSPKKKRAAE